MNSIKLSLDPIMCVKIEKLALQRGLSFDKFLTSFFANWVSTPTKRLRSRTASKRSFCRKGVDTSKKHI